MDSYGIINIGTGELSIPGIIFWFIVSAILVWLLVGLWSFSILKTFLVAALSAVFVLSLLAIGLWPYAPFQ